MTEGPMDSAGKRGVIYFNLGVKCCVRLLVSLHSLRKHYDGPVTILCADDEGKEICDRIGSTAGATVLPIPIQYRKKNTAYCKKAQLWRDSQFQTTVLVDSDTTFNASPEPLFDLAENDPSGLVVTHFSDWRTTGRLVGERIRKWHGVKCKDIDVEALIAANLEAPRAAINTGIVTFRSDAEVLPDWEALTAAGWRCPFTDEIALQQLVRKYAHVLTDDRWNCSPNYGINKDKAKIWHYHGHHELCPYAVGHWLPQFMEVWNNNCASIRTWMPNADRQRLTENGVIL